MMINLYDVYILCLLVYRAVSMDDMMAFHTKYLKENTTGKHSVLKAKFSLFNSGMNAIENVKGEWRLTSPMLREGLTSDLYQSIAPIYTDFYQKYSVVEFSKKHMNEYLLWQPTNIDRYFLTFFEVAR